MASWKDIPFAQEAKFCKAVANAVLAGANLPIYRTVDGKVQTFKLHHIQLDWGNGSLHAVYERDGDLVTEPASRQDLKLLADFAQQQVKKAK